MYIVAYILSVSLVTSGVTSIARGTVASCVSSIVTNIFVEASEDVASHTWSHPGGASPSAAHNTVVGTSNVVGNLKWSSSHSGAVLTINTASDSASTVGRKTGAVGVVTVIDTS